MTSHPGSMPVIRSLVAVVTAALSLSAPSTGTCLSASELPQTAPRAGAERPLAPGVADARAAGTAAVRVSVWSAANQLVPGVSLRLRNAANGKVLGAGVTDALGQVTFVDVVEGTYAVEVVTASGKVLVVGPRFGAAPGETIATFIRLGTEVPWFTGFFSNAALAVTTTAAAAGVTALAPGEQRPVSARK